MQKLRRVEGGYLFYCPGCDDIHIVGDGWQFNGNLESPTFSPSILVRSGHFVPEWKPGDSCWCTYNKDCVDKGEEPCSFKCINCHSHIMGKYNFVEIVLIS